MKWVKPFAIGDEYLCIPDKVNNLTAERKGKGQPTLGYALLRLQRDNYRHEFQN